MVEMCKITHNNYDRITDKVMWLGFGATLNFNVDLYYMRSEKFSKDKIKENFHREVMYKPNPDGEYRVKIIRDFNYYFTIDLSTKDMKNRVIITANEIYFLVFNLKAVMKWFIGENGVNNIFAKRPDGRIFIPTKPESIKIQLAFNTSLEIEPRVEIIDGYDTIGVRLYMNNANDFFFMPSNNVFSLVHMFSTCNMYQLAQNMLNYMGRPEYGTNSYDMTANTIQTNSNNTPGGFFDRVGAKRKDSPVGD